MGKALGISVLLLVTTLAVGQTYNPTAAAQQAATPNMGGPVFTAPLITFPVQAGGLLLQSGYATTVGWGYPPVLITPSASFTTISASPVGATNATSNLQVGATNATVDSLTPTFSAVLTVAETIQPGAVVPTGFIPEISESEGGGTGVGAASFDVVTARGYHYAHPPLGDTVRQLREQGQKPPVRTITNSDVEHIKNEPLEPAKR